MYYYVDESGHTGTNLFDENQPMLYYGLLSSRFDLDGAPAALVKKVRGRLGVERLHAAELGHKKISLIIPSLLQIQRELGINFNAYTVAKPDHAVICFFDQVFDSGVNKAMTWTGYWTPLRYLLLLRLALIFDEELAQKAWEARICLDSSNAERLLKEVCLALTERLDFLPDERTKELVGDALEWAINNPEEISFNVRSKKDRLAITPNIVGFQSVMHGIAASIKGRQIEAKKIVVDQQSQFNQSQKTLAEFYADAAQIDWATGPGLPKMEMENMPQIPIHFSSGRDSAGLELVDIYLWVFKRLLETNQLGREFLALMMPFQNLGYTYEVSLLAIANRWEPFFKNLPELEDMPPEQVEVGKKMQEEDEKRRRTALARSRSISRKT